MPTESIQVSARFPVTPDELFRAWLDSDQHSLFTGGRARIDPSVGGRFSAWADYISGRTLEIEPGRRVVQAWRTIEFPLEAPDSRLEARFESENGGTRLILVHSGIPEGQSDHYEEGWISTYFEPMQRYFRWRGANGTGRARKARRVRKAAAKRTVAKHARKTASKVRKAAGRKVARKAAGRKRVRTAVGRKVARKVVRKKVARRTVRKKVVRTAARRTIVRKAVRRKVVRATARTRRARARK